MAVGKSTIGKKIATKLGYTFYDLDQMIVQQTGHTISEIFAAQGESYFRTLEKAVLHKTISINNAVIACGGGSACFFDNIHWMNKNGTTVWLHTKVEFIVQRVLAAKHERPLLQHLSAEALKEKVLQQLKERQPFYEKAHLHYHQHEMEFKDFMLHLAEH
jgi:shikimate kinase